MTITYEQLSEDRPKRVRKSAVKILRNFIPDQLIDAYIDERKTCLAGTGLWRPGWPSDTPYLQIESMRNLALYPPLMAELKAETEEDMGLHLTLTGFQSTERRWHADSYLNPPFVGDKYLAVWFALGEIVEDAGPFEWAEGSECWPVITREKVWRFLTPEQTAKPDWPVVSQDCVSDACEAEIKKRSAITRTFIASKGDVLIWDSDLVHQGSKPKDPTRERPALIAHYSALSVRHDMPKRRQHTNGSWYFYFD